MKIYLSNLNMELALLNLHKKILSIDFFRTTINFRIVVVHSVLLIVHVVSLWHFVYLVERKIKQTVSISVNSKSNNICHLINQLRSVHLDKIDVSFIDSGRIVRTSRSKKAIDVSEKVCVSHESHIFIKLQIRSNQNVVSSAHIINIGIIETSQPLPNHKLRLFSRFTSHPIASRQERIK